MSDMMMGGGMQPDPAEDAAAQNVAQNRSMLNPTDGAFMAQSGQVNPDMTVGQFIENTFHVKWEDPLAKLQEAAKSQLKNRTPAGKMNALAGGAQGAPPPGGMPPGGQPPMPQGGGGMDEMMAQMGQ